GSVTDRGHGRGEFAPRRRACAQSPLRPLHCSIRYLHAGNHATSPQPRTNGSNAGQAGARQTHVTFIEVWARLNGERVARRFSSEGGLSMRSTMQVMPDRDFGRGWMFGYGALVLIL